MAAADPDLTVCVCTWNRAAMLEDALEHLGRMDVPEGIRWELLVVNNGCTDRTSEVVASFAPRLPIREVHEPRPGLSHARNRGVGAARGAYLVWTDDDVYVDPDWLAAYARAFRRHPAAAVFGGPIRLQLEGRPPPWLAAVLPRVGAAYGLRDLGGDPFRLAPGSARLPFGANFAVRMREHRDHRYSTALGRRHDAADPPRGEEVELMTALLRGGAEGWWVPDAVVRHRVTTAMQSVRYLRSYYRAYGAYEAATGRVASRIGWTRVLAAEARYRLARAVRPPERWIQSLITAAVARGHVSRRRGSP